MQLIAVDSLESKQLKKLKYQTAFNSEQRLEEEIQEVILFLKKEGFFTTYIEKKTKTNNKYLIYLNLGKQLLMAKIQIPSQLIKQLNNFSFDKNILELPINKLPDFLENLSKKLEQQGQGFSKFSLTQSHIEKSTFIATLSFQEAKPRNIDKIIIKGFPNFPENFTKHYFQAKNKNILNAALLENLSIKTAQLAFASEIKPPEVLFSKDATFIYMYLKEEKNSSFDGMINFSSKEQSGGIQLSGYLDLKLINTFNYGEELKIHWKNNGNEKQVIELGAKLPFLFKSSLTGAFDFSLYRSDSTFLTNTIHLGLSTALTNKTSIGLQYSFESSKELLNNSPDSIKAYQKQFIGPSFHFNSNNKSNYEFSIQTTIGTKQVLTNTIPQYKIDFTGSILTPLSKRLTAYIKNTSGFLISDNLFFNENYRLGGINNFRGFREESIFASKYSFVNTELRFSTQEKSYLYTLFDFGSFFQTNKNKILYAFGVGYAYSLKNNTINFNYTYGISDSSPNNSLINVKFLTIF